MEYNALLSAYAKSGKARQSEELLKEMVASPTVQPDLISYNCVLLSWSKSGQEGAADRAASILSSLPNADAKSYSSVIYAHVKEGNMKHVRTLLQQASAQGIVLDAHLQNAILSVHANKGNAKLAEECLEEMEQEGIATTISYNTVIKAWKHSGAADMSQRAEAMLHRMVARKVDDVISYTSVVRRDLCCVLCVSCTRSILYTSCLIKP